MTRTYHVEAKKVQCNLYSLVELGNSNAETLFQAICSAFEKESIPLSDLLLTLQMPCLGSVIVWHHVQKKRFHIFISCDEYVIVHIFVLHMHVKSFQELLKICYMMCTTTFAIVQNVSQNSRVFNTSLKLNLINCYIPDKHICYPFIHVFLG